MLTIQKLKNLLTEELLNSLKKNTGITEFFIIGNISIGICYEDGDVDIGEEKEKYIFNIFFEDEYLNISYEPSDKGLNDMVFQEVCDVFNRYFNVRSYLASEIQLNFSKEEKSNWFGDVSSSNEILERLDMLASKPTELLAIFKECFSEEEIGNILILLL